MCNTFPNLTVNNNNEKPYTVCVRETKRCNMLFIFNH